MSDELTLAAAYQVACQLLGEQIVLQRHLSDQLVSKDAELIVARQQLENTVHVHE